MCCFFKVRRFGFVLGSFQFLGFYGLLVLGQKIRIVKVCCGFSFCYFFIILQYKGFGGGVEISFGGGEIREEGMKGIKRIGLIDSFYF